eukprot:gb/GFBE01046943.1/.p1 GENE.gb/GFBE01046943.1/~~gb/GFBE01046943.1/.p1  ORF type:complete len:310 (+),score=36.79 gb/GFBE01046943.1/:1-930(+)
MAAGLPSWSPSLVGRASPSTPSPRHCRTRSGAASHSAAAVGITPAPTSPPPAARQGSSVGANARRKGHAVAQPRRAMSNTPGNSRAANKAIASSPPSVAKGRGVTDQRSSPSRIAKPGSSPSVPWRPSGGQGGALFAPPPRRRASSTGASAAHASGPRQRAVEEQSGLPAKPSSIHAMQARRPSCQEREDAARKEAARVLEHENRTLRFMAERLQQELAVVEERGRCYRSAAQELLAGHEDYGSDESDQTAESELEESSPAAHQQHAPSWQHHMLKLEAQLSLREQQEDVDKLWQGMEPWLGTEPMTRA